jgi:hypothetical protein
MNAAWNPVVWLCLGLFAMAEFGNYRMGGELTRMCEMVGQQGPNREVDSICADHLPAASYLQRLEARQAHGD